MTTTTDDTTRGGGVVGTTDGARDTSRARRSTTRRREDARPRATTSGAAVDLAALVVLLAAVGAGFAPVWGSAGFLLPALGGMALGLGVAWVGAWRRWSAVVVVALAAFGYLLLGGIFAAPATTLAGVVPTPETWRVLLLGSVEGWKEFVTTVPPLYSFPDLAVVVFLTMMITALVAASIAWRARQGQWALLPVVAGFVGVILLGTLEPAWPVVQGLALALTGLLWGGLRAAEARTGTHAIATDASREATRRLRWYRVRTGAAILGVAGLAAVLTAPAVMPDRPRTVLRETVVPPLELHEFGSPLVAFRKYAKELREVELFTVSGLPEDGRVRLATLDQYDGVVFDATGEGGDTGVFTRIGQEVASAADGAPTEVGVTVTGYDGVWLPEVGALTGVRWDGPNAPDQADSTYYNSATHTALTTVGVRPGDAYTLRTLVEPEPTEDELRQSAIAAADLPQTPRSALPAGLATKTSQFTGEEIDPATRLFLIRDALASSGQLSSGLQGQAPSRPGHSAQRIDTLVESEQMVGDDEQFAVALALMARQAGIPARVVMGFYPGEDSTYTPGEPWTVLGSDVHAWVEVPFEEHGWTPIDAVPEEKPQIQPEPKSEQVPKPPVLQDPEPPEEPEVARSGTVEGDDEEETENEGFDWSRLGLILLATVIPLALLLAPVVAVLAYKARRRTRRRTADDLAARFSGGWHEVVDLATDLGTAVPSSATRREGARRIADALEAPTGVLLAERADAHVFGAGSPTPEEAEQYWREVDGLVGEVRAGVGRRRRIRAALSWRSVRLRRRSRSKES
jgi:hypothetical protein